MTLIEILTDFGRFNLAAGAAVIAVAMARKPVRRTFGAGAAYALWAVVPLAAAASLLPARQEVRTLAATSQTFQSADPMVTAAPSAAPALPAAAALDPWVLVAFLWAAGAVAATLWIAYAQRQAITALKAGDIGPAVVGVFRPRIVTPPDFDQRFDAEERELVLAHEQTHIRRHDARVNAAVALFQCLNWFNPLIHLGAHLMRVDQEMACDAQALAPRPQARRLYAQALLKAQLAAHPLPLGCYWPAGTEHPLMERIAMLKTPNPTHFRRFAGGFVIAGLAAGGALAAWTAQPVEVAYVAAPAQARAPAVAVPVSAPTPQTAAPPKAVPVEEAEAVLPAEVCLSNACGGEAAVIGQVGPVEVDTCEQGPCRDVGAKRIPSYSAFVRYFDGNSPVLIRGTVAEVRFQSGTSSELVIVGEDGQSYRVTGGDVDNLPPEARAAFETLPGEQVVVRGYNAFDQSCEGGGCIVNGRDVTFADGGRLFTPNPQGASSTPSQPARR